MQNTKKENIARDIIADDSKWLALIGDCQPPLPDSCAHFGGDLRVVAAEGCRAWLVSMLRGDGDISLACYIVESDDLQQYLLSDECIDDAVDYAITLCDCIESELMIDLMASYANDVSHLV